MGRGGGSENRIALRNTCIMICILYAKEPPDGTEDSQAVCAFLCHIYTCSSRTNNILKTAKVLIKAEY